MKRSSLYFRVPLVLLVRKLLRVRVVFTHADEVYLQLEGPVHLIPQGEAYRVDLRERKEQWFSNGGTRSPRGTLEYCRGTPGKKKYVVYILKSRQKKIEKKDKWVETSF